MNQLQKLILSGSYDIASTHVTNGECSECVTFDAAKVTSSNPTFCQKPVEKHAMRDFQSLGTMAKVVESLVRPIILKNW